jgi:hypothetical protein
VTPIARRDRRILVAAALVVLPSLSAAAGPAAAALILAPPDGARIGYDRPRAAVTVLTWRAIAGAERYRIRLAIEGSPEKPLVDRTLDGSSTPLRGLVVLSKHVVHCCDHPGDR